MTRILATEPRCSNRIHCVAYTTLREPTKLSRGNPGTTCFACEERRVASELKTAAAKSKAVERGKTNEPRWGKSDGLEEHVGREHAAAARVREIWERRKRSVLTCERGLRSAVASGDERLVRKWPRLLREAEVRLVWTEADLDAAETRARSEHAC